MQTLTRAAIIALFVVASALLSAQTTGGFVELSTSTTARPVLTAAQIAAMVPAGRKQLVFPAPYGTTAWRLTIPADCPGSTDCVNYTGYAYWRRISNTAASSTLKVFVSLRKDRGGIGPAVVVVDKTTGTVSAPLPLFLSSDKRSADSGETWYFSGSMPDTLYFQDDTTAPALKRINVATRTESPVFSLADPAAVAVFGSGRYPFQANSSNDDNAHSFTVKDGATYAALGCGVYLEASKTYKYFPTRGTDFDECQIDKSGGWLLIKEQVDGVAGEDNRIINLVTGVETLLLDQDGAAGHSDMGYGSMIAADNWYAQPGAWRYWDFTTSPLGPKTVEHLDPSWVTGSLDHVSWSNAVPGGPTGQIVCGSSANRVAGPRVGEITCFPLDGSLRALVVAPVMTDLNAAGGGDDYGKLPKGNLDVTGQYFTWTANLGGGRLDAFLVRVPVDKLAPAPAAPAPPCTITITVVAGVAHVAPAHCGS